MATRKRAPTVAAPTKYVVIAEGLNLRAAPSLHGKVKRVLAKDAVLKRLDVSGDGYWIKVRAKGVTGWAAHKYLQARAKTRQRSDLPWYAIARAEIGVREVQGDGDNPRIVEYLRSTTLDPPLASQDETFWCSAFANWCVERSGHAGTDSAWARSWLNWGRPTKVPTRGCVVILERGAGAGHVGFFVSATATHITLLGGNQSDQVCEASFPVTRLLGYRIPR